jgi:hypothetical protein
MQFSPVSCYPYFTSLIPTCFPQHHLPVASEACPRLEIKGYPCYLPLIARIQNIALCQNRIQYERTHKKKKVIVCAFRGPPDPRGALRREVCGCFIHATAPFSESLCIFPSGYKTTFGIRTKNGGEIVVWYVYFR